MAEAFALAASVIGVLGFTLQLWTETKEIRKTGSTIETADCARDAQSLQKLCDQVKELQKTETDLSEAARIKEIAAEIREVAEELASRLAKCELPADQKGLRRYRDVISVLWHGMRMDADSQMRRLAALRQELVSELLVSMSKRLDLGALRQSAWFQSLDYEVKHQADLILEEQKAIKKAINDLDVSAERRHAQVLRRLDRLPSTKAGASYDPEARKRDRIQELCERLWFDAIPRRHHAIKAAHQKTFEWIFTGQKKTAQSNTTFQEWMTSGKGLYWISGRAGTGKSSLMKFLDDDPRTEPTFQRWAGGRKLVLAKFYFWNSEAANDDQLKSLSGLYKGILYSLIKQEDKFAELMFPNHFVDGRYWQDNFPTLLDMDEAFARLANAAELPAAVGLIIDGLDEYDATSGEQMTMAQNLLRASNSPNLKILVSSRPEDAFETIFKDSTKLRLHELTEQDRQTYASDCLRALPRFQDIATQIEQATLIDLIVKKSEGIFLWVYLAVETVLQEIPLSMNIARLEKVVEDIPSGNKELSRVFDHILRNRIPTKYRLVGYSLIKTLQFSYTLPDKIIPWIEGPGYKHQITALLLSFFEDDVQSVLGLRIGPLKKTEAESRVEVGENLIRKACAGLLETRDQDDIHTDSPILGRPILGLGHEIDRPVHYIHKDLGLYLNQEDTSRFLNEQPSALKLSIETNLLKCFVVMMKLYNPNIPKHFSSRTLRTQVWDIWRFLEGAMRIARDAEVYDPEVSMELLDELDRVMIHYHSRGRLPAQRAMFPHSGDLEPADFLDPKDEKHWSNEFPIDSHYRLKFDFEDEKAEDPELTDFIAFTIEQGLVQYCVTKLSKDGKAAIAKKGRPLLSSACGNPHICWHIDGFIRHETVQLLIEKGADPNELFRGVSCWQNALFTTKCFSDQDQALASFQELEKILRLMLEAGANPHAGLQWTTRNRISKGNWETITHTQGAVEIVENTFILGKPDIPIAYWRARRDSTKHILTKDDRAKIARLGAGLLDLLREKQKTTPRKATPPKPVRSNTGNSTITGISSWRRAMSRRTKIWKVRFQSRFSGKWKPRT
ncbi:hypothetical protein V8F20_009066 [Naviculisporaceae sp. PSN 640]